MSDIHKELVGGIRLVEEWPTPGESEEYWILLTPRQYDEVMRWAWRHYGVAQLLVLISEEACASQ